MAAESIAELMAAVGPRDPDIVAVVELGSGGWIIRYEGADFEVELDDPSERLLISTELGAVPAEGRAPVLTAMLNYNLLWRETGGVRMALTADGTAVQIADLASGIGVEALSTALQSLRGKVEVWRKVIASGAEKEEGLDPFSLGAIRV